MSYLALYRQFRPTTFDQIIGQDHVVKTLTNQINTDRVGHAYLFCGARGTGKTTAAKVFARAINCLSPINGSPCGECEACKKLENPANLDILEMDAASNNKVENVRDIRDKIQYPPVAGRYKVYIIDEVHMLTTEAFNALLKTLEEPPAHAVFILATTEVHKIPATILSRCLRFDFKLIATNKIAQFIGEIYDKVGKKYQKEAIMQIAKAGEGSVRDALSIADICLSYSQKQLTYADVLEVLGTSDRAVIENLISAMFQGETGQMLSLIDELCMRGKSVGVLNRDVCSCLRDLLVIKTCKNSGEILTMPEDKLNELKKVANVADVHALLRAIEIFSSAEADLKYSTHPKIVFETAAVKASLPSADYNIDALMGRIGALENSVKNGEFTVKQVVTQTVQKQEKVKKQVEEVKQEIQEKPVYSAINEVKEEKVELKKEQEQPLFSGVEEIKQPPLKQEEVKQDNEKSYKQEIDEDLASLMASYEDIPEEPNENQFSFFGGDFTAPKQENSALKATENKVEKPAVKEDKKQEKPAYSAINEQEKVVKSTNKKPLADGQDCSLVWGAILRKLRQDKQIMLWVACQDVTTAVSGGFIMVKAPGENEYGLLSKPENVATLGGYAKSEGFEGVKIVKEYLDLNEKVIDADEQAVTEYFEGENLKIKD